MKRISVIILTVVATVMSVLAFTTPAQASVTSGCTAVLDSGTRQDILFKNGNGATLSFAKLSVIKAQNYANIYCVKFGTSGLTVQRYDAYTRLNLTSTGACPVPGGYGGGFEPPYGRGYDKQLYVEPGTCYRVLYGIKYGGDYYYAQFMRKRV